MALPWGAQASTSTAPSVALIRNEEPQECEEASIDAMTDGHTPSDDNEKRRLDPTGNACVDLPVGSVDLHHASAVECSAKRNHSEAGMGRQLGDQVGVTPALTTPPKTYSRKAKGECGERIGRKIDLLVAEIQASATPAEIEHKRTCVSVCCAPVPELSSVDPPAPAFGGGADRASDESAGGGTGFPHDATAWDAFSGRNQCVNEITEFLQMLDDEPRLRSAAMLRSLSRVREQLESMPETADLTTPVCIPLRDTLVLLTQSMQRLR